MASLPPPVNGTANTINKVISAANNIGVAIVENLIIADVPALGLPIIRQLWEIPFNWIMGYVVKAERGGATFAVIDIQTGSEESGISQALAALVAAEKTGDKNAIQAAIKNYQAAQSALVNSDGSAPIG